MLNYTRNKNILFATLGIAIVVVILSITGLSALIVYGGALQTTIEHQLNKADDFAQAADTTPHDGVVFLGDSITEMYDLDIFFPDREYINRGISSNETAQVIDRLATNVISIKPKTIVLLIGANDIGHSISDEQFMENFTLICETIATELPDTKLIIQSIYPTRTLNNLNSYYGTKLRTNERVLSTNALITAEVARLSVDQNIQYANTHSVLVDEAGLLAREYTIDGLHISQSGYTVITKYLAEFI